MRVLIVLAAIAVSVAYCSAHDDEHKSCLINKQGACAKPKDVQCVKQEDRQCKCDNECKGSKKCCDIHCGGSKCRAPKRYCWPAGANPNNWGDDFNTICECKKARKCKGKSQVCDEGKSCKGNEVCCCPGKLAKKAKKFALCSE